MSSLRLSADAPPYLPRRPRWRPDIPLLWRDSSTVHIGDHPARPELSRTDALWLLRLEGLATYAEILGTHPDAARLIRLARSVGALEDSTEIPPAARWATDSERELVWARARAVTGPQQTDVLKARDRARIDVVGTGQLAAAVRQLLPESGLREYPPAGTHAEANTGSATLTVLADAHHPRVPRIFDGRTHDGPHLHVAARGANGVAGPLVIPGHTSCLRCAHLHECDRDSAWPLLSIQWAQAPTPCVDPLLIHAVAIHAVVMTRRFVDGDPLVDAALVMDLSDIAGRHLARPPHPMCGCRWPDADPLSSDRHDADPVSSRAHGPVMR